MPPLIDLTKQRFGQLIVLGRGQNNKWGEIRWLCRCDCGKQKTILRSSLLKGKTKSCGCLHDSGNNTRHNHAKTNKQSKIYTIWKGVIQRCTNPNNRHYHNYGGRKINVCKRWLKFDNFLEDMGEPLEGLLLDRINNNKGYYKSNCRWATRKQQNRNTRKNHLKTYGGRTQCIAAWAEEYGMKYMTLWQRIRKLDWSIEKALTTPVKQRKVRRIVL